MRPASRRATILTSPPHRAGPAFGVVLVLAGLLAAVSPSVPAARALDPTPDPSPSEPAPTQEATPDPTPAATPDPTPDATPDPTPDPTAEPTPAPTPDPTPDPTPAATPDPTSPPEASEAPVEPTPEPSADPSADPGATPVADANRPRPPDSPPRTPGSTRSTSSGAPPARVPSTGRWGTPTGSPCTGSRFRLVNAGDEPLTVHAGAPGRLGRRLVAGARGRPGRRAGPSTPRPTTAGGSAPAPSRSRSRTSGSPADADSTPVAGRSSSGVNPMPEVTIPAHGATEVAFAIRATMDAAWGTAYELRLVEGGPSRRRRTGDHHDGRQACPRAVARAAPRAIASPTRSRSTGSTRRSP